MTLPNVLTLFRLLMVPLVAALYWVGQRYFALALFLLAGITDMLDGYIARRTNKITDLGKVMDPLADKLLVLATLVCFYFVDQSIPLWLLITLFVKETLMVLGGVFLYKWRNFAVSSRYYGKISAALLFLGITLTFLREYTWPYCLYTLYAALALSLLSMVPYAKNNLISRLKKTNTGGE